MIVRINYRESFGRTVGYAMKLDKFPELVGGNLSARDTTGIIGEFELLAALNTRCKMPVAHLSFSLAKGEYLEATQWAEFAQRVSAEYGFEQFVAVRHHDTDCEHIHLIGNRIKLDGKAVSTSNDRHRMRTLCQQAEKDFGLDKTALRSPRVRVNKDELERANRLYRQKKKPHPIPPKLIIAEQIQANAFLARTHTDFVDRCQSQGINVRWRFAPDGRRTGVSFSEDNSTIYFSGTSLGLPLSRLNQNLNNNGKDRYPHARGTDPRMAPSARSGLGSRTAAAAGKSALPAHETGRDNTRSANAGSAFKQQSGEPAGGADHPDRDPSGNISQEEKNTMIDTIENALLGVATGLIDGLESIDDAISISTPTIRVKRERRISR